MGHPSPESHHVQYAQDRMQREQLAFLRGPVTRMEMQDAMQRMQGAMSTIQLSTELLAQFFVDKGQFTIEEFRAYCVTKMQTIAAAQSGPAEPAEKVGPNNRGLDPNAEWTSQTPTPSGIVLTDGDDHAADCKGTQDSGEHAEPVREQ